MISIFINGEYNREDPAIPCLSELNSLNVFFSRNYKILKYRKEHDGWKIKIIFKKLFCNY